MMISTNGLLDFAGTTSSAWHANGTPLADRAGLIIPAAPPCFRDAAFLRRCAWEIGETRPADAFTPATSHVGLAAVCPAQGFVHWRILPEWVEQTARQKGDA